jgi:glutathione synthase/RimK-type ligase-like ATP-grasp enzyme
MLLLLETSQMPPSLAILSPETEYELDWSSSFVDIGDALSAVGIAAYTVPWPASASHRPDAVSPLLAWGYQRKIAQWTGLLDGFSGQSLMINAPELLRWNSAKHYLFDLGRAGIPIVPTIYRASVTRSELPAVFREFDTEALIVKPVVGAASEGLIRIASPDDAPAIMTEVLLQPFLESVCEHGELSLVYFSGSFSHAVCKKPRAGDIRVQDHFGARSFSAVPPEECLVLGERAVGACPGVPTYARVDMVRDDAQFCIMEVELIEPELYLKNDPGNMARFAEAVARTML